MSYTTPTVTPRPEASPLPPPDPAHEPNIRLVYDRYEFLLVNISDHTLDVSRLVFEQPFSDGTTRQFEARSWDRPDVTARPSAMIHGACYQLLTAESRQTAPSRADCPQRLGFFSTGVIRRYFWIAKEPDAVFSVHRLGDTTPLITCAIDAGQCEFYLPES